MDRRCKQTLWLFDWKPHAEREDAEAQAAELDRTASRIAAVVFDFCAEHYEREFFAQDLRDYVVRQQLAAPASPDRILRHLRQLGAVRYIVVDRRKSLYRITEIRRDKAPSREEPR